MGALADSDVADPADEMKNAHEPRLTYYQVAKAVG